MSIEKAWIQFTPGVPPVINIGKRIDSLTRNAAGDYSLGLTDDLVSTSAGCLMGLERTAAQVAANTQFHIEAQVVDRRTLRVRTIAEDLNMYDVQQVSLSALVDENTSIGD